MQQQRHPRHMDGSVCITASLSVRPNNCTNHIFQPQGRSSLILLFNIHWYPRHLLLQSGNSWRMDNWRAPSLQVARPGVFGLSSRVFSPWDFYPRSCQGLAWHPENHLLLLGEESHAALDEKMLKVNLKPRRNCQHVLAVRNYPAAPK